MAERASPFSMDVTATCAGVSMAACDRGSLWQIAAWPDTFQRIEAELAVACGADVPAPGRIVTTGDGRRLIRVEPLKWWIMGADGAPCPMEIDAEDGASLDLSHDQAGIQLSGPNAAEILKRMVSIDVRDHAFPDGSFATTHMHHMITRVLRADADGPRYEVMVMRSYADDLAEIAAHHIQHFG